MMSFRSFLLLTAIIGGAVFWFNQGPDSPEVEDQEIKEALETSTPQMNSTVSLRTVLDKFVSENNSSSSVNVTNDPRTPRAVYGGTQRNAEALARREFSSQQIEEAQEYFDKLIASPPTKRLYQKAKKIFGTSTSGEGAAKWATLGVAFDSSTSYGYALDLAMKDTNTDAESLMGQIKKSSAIIRKDPFIYQMTINLVYQMNLESAEKAQYYGKELELQLKNLGPSKPSDSFWVATMGLMLAQQAGVKAGDIGPYLQRGLANTHGPGQVIIDFKKTATFYFPSLRL